VVDHGARVLAHCLEPENVGVVEQPDGVGVLGDVSCGDFVVMFLKVHRERLLDVKYLVRGSCTAVAACSALSRLAKGLTVKRASLLTGADVVAELDGSPEDYAPACNVIVAVLQRAIADYRRRQSRGSR
jgi:nitrogen fixation NifU-like protein